MSQENLAGLKRLYERLAAGDLQAGADLFDRYFVFVSDPGDPEGQVHYGLDAFTGYMRRFREIWGDMRFEAKDYREAEKHVPCAGASVRDWQTRRRVARRGGLQFVDLSRREGHPLGGPPAGGRSPESGRVPEVALWTTGGSRWLGGAAPPSREREASRPAC
jgi:ketosteroid isomerase-like protein